jgi:Zn ribbon nucleic-acid-binding protein
MNQLVGQDHDGSPGLILILEPSNIHKLFDNEPIDLRVESMFPDGIPRKLRLVIAHSETPVADAKKLAEMSDVSLDERTYRIKTKVPHCPECHTTIEQLGVWRNESAMALTFCVGCGCVFGMVPSEVVRQLKKGE